MSKIARMPIAAFVAELEAALHRKDGYIMGATGQDPRQWPEDSWWFTQYDKNPKQKRQALYWRAHAQHVWDCNGLAEGIYRNYTGVDINSKARYNYAQWCDPKDTGLIPARFRVPGAAVFWGESASEIHHVAYLYKPVAEGKPGGDWYLIEARGVMYGVVETRLYDREPDYWGWMTKYFDYGEEAAMPALRLGDRLLKQGCEGEDVKQLQTCLIRLGYDCGKWGADGEFGDATELALRRFQKAHGLRVDGEFGEKSLAELEKAMAELDAPVETPKTVEIVGGNCYVRAAPGTSGRKLGVVHEGDRLPFAGEIDEETRWLKVEYKGKAGWVSGKYGKLVK